MSSDRERLQRLVAMATLVSDARAHTLRLANEVRTGLQQQLTALDTTHLPENLPWPAMEKAVFGYEQWAARRRAEINLRLAAQTAVCLLATEETRLSFGRKIAVEKLATARLRSVHSFRSDLL